VIDEVTILESCLAWFTGETGIPHLIEPQQIEPPAPTLRLMITGFAEQGENRETIKAVGTINAYGDGPKSFLTSVAAASRKMVELTERNNPFAIDITHSATVTFRLLADGRFQENESEQPHFPFLWNEQYAVEISYNKSFLG